MIDKDIFIDAIIGRGFHSMVFADAMVKRGLAKFSGNQWNEDWQWLRDKLNALSLGELKAIYTEAKGI